LKPTLHPGDRFTVDVTGRRGTLVGPGSENHWKVILDELDDVTEFTIAQLRFD
jgi:hypothetical protein